MPPAESIRALECGYPGVVCLHAPVAGVDGSLTPAEAAVVDRAVPKRRAEFATGRRLAHRAMRDLGKDCRDLLSGAQRQPLWPPGVRGSIAHTHSDATVLVSGNPDILGLGVDLEHCGRLAGSLLPRILTPRERDRLAGLDPTLIFSAKEAVYKLLHPMFGEYVDFLDVEVKVDSCSSTFSLEYTGDASRYSCLQSVGGDYREIEGCWLTRVFLDARDLATSQDG